MPAGGQTFQDNLILVLSADPTKLWSGLQDAEERVEAFGRTLKSQGQAARESAKSTQQSAKATDQSKTSTSRATKSQQAYTGSLVSTTHSFRRMTASMTTGNLALDEFSMRLDRASMFMWRFNIAMIPLQQIEFQMMAVTAVMVGLEAASINAYREVAKMANTFKGMGDSAEEAGQKVDFLLDKAKTLPFTFDQVAGAAMAFRVSGIAETREELDLWLESAADLAAAATTEQGHDIARAAEAMVDAVNGEIRRMRNTYHVSMEAIQEYSGDTEEAIRSLIEAKWGGTAAAQMESLEGSISNFLDALRRAGIALGEDLAPSLQVVLGHGTDLLNWLEAVINGMDSFAIAAPVIIGTLVPALTLLASTIGRLYMQFIGLKGAFLIATQSVGPLYTVIGRLTQAMNELAISEAEAIEQEMALAGSAQQHAMAREELAGTMNMQAAAQQKLTATGAIEGYERMLQGAFSGAMRPQMGVSQMALPALGGIEQVKGSLRALGIISQKTGVSVGVLRAYLDATGKTVTELTGREIDLLVTEAERVGILNQEAAAAGESATANELAAAAKEKEAAAAAVAANKGSIFARGVNRLGGFFDSAAFKMGLFAAAAMGAMVAFSKFQQYLQKTADIYEGMVSPYEARAQTTGRLGYATEQWVEQRPLGLETERDIIKGLNDSIIRMEQRLRTIKRYGSWRPGEIEELEREIEELKKRRDRRVGALSVGGPPIYDERVREAREKLERVVPGGRVIPGVLQEDISELEQREQELIAAQEEGEVVAQDLWQTRHRLYELQLEEAKAQLVVHRYFGREEMAKQDLVRINEILVKQNENSITGLKDAIDYRKTLTQYLDLQDEGSRAVIESYKRLAALNRSLATSYAAQGKNVEALRARIAALNAEQAIQNIQEEEAEEQKKKLEEAEKDYIQALERRVGIAEALARRRVFEAGDVGIMDPAAYTAQVAVLHRQAAVARAEGDQSALYDIGTDMFQLQEKRNEAYEDERQAIVKNRYELAQAYEEQGRMTQAQVDMYRDQLIANLQQRIVQEDLLSEKIALQTELIKLQADEAEGSYDDIIKRIIGGPAAVDEAVSQAAIMRRFGPNAIGGSGVSMSNAMRVVSQTGNTLTIEVGAGSVKRLEQALSSAGSEAFTRAFIETMLERIQ